MRPVALALALLVALAGPAAAHRLKLFATVEDGTITGYGFFIGGGRPQGATLVIRDSAGDEVYRGATDDSGAFSWRPDKADDYALVIDARDGHVADARIGADRFDADRFGDDTGAKPSAAAPASSGDGAALAATAIVPAPAATDPAALEAAIDRAVDRAVARQIRPLLEAYDEADGRIRFNDVVGGIGMIVGMAGIAMWASARRKNAPAAPPGEAGS